MSAEHQRRYKERHPERVIASKRKAYAKVSPEARRAYANKWAKENPELKYKERKNYRARHPEKYTAHMRARKLIRPSVCSKCGVKCRPQAHHDDYSKPLDVTWLCFKCHRGLHIEGRVKE